MYQERLRELYIELEDIDNHIQHGCIDTAHLEGMNYDCDNEEFMNHANEKICDAMGILEDLIDVMNGEKKI